METLRCPLRVLIADGCAPIRERIARMLFEEAQAEVVGQTSGVAETITAIHALRPDVVLLELDLAHGNGLDVLRLGRYVLQHPHFIILTDNPIAEYARAAARHGAFAFFDKACEFDKAVGLIRQLSGAVPQTERQTPERQKGAELKDY